MGTKNKSFEVRKVSLGAQNRPEEAPKGDKKRYRKNKNEKKGKEEHQERHDTKKGFPIHSHAWPGGRSGRAGGGVRGGR